MTLNELRSREQLLASITSEWRSRLRPVVQNLAASGSAPAVTDEEYLALRTFWLNKYEQFARDIFSIWPDDVQVRNGMSTLRDLFSNSQWTAFLVAVVAPVGGVYAHPAKWRIDELDSVVTRYEARLKQERDALPGWWQTRRADVGRTWSWVASRPDWIETHPKNLWLLAGLVALVLAWQAPDILDRLTRLVQAVKGG